MAQRKGTQLVSMTMWVQSPASLSGSGIPRCCGCRPAATTQIRPLAWELPGAAGVALLKKKSKKIHNKGYYH